MKPGPLLLLLLAALPDGELLLLLSGMTTAGLTVGVSPGSCLAALLGRLTATAEAAARRNDGCTGGAAGARSAKPMAMSHVWTLRTFWSG
jgi:hypothetical protein